MRNEKKLRESGKHSIWAIIIAVIYGIAMVAFGFSMFRLNVLPTTYFIVVAIVLLLISFLLIKGVLNPKKGKGAVVAGIIACILAVGLIAATAMITGTLSFMKGIVAGGTQIHNYHVIVREDSAYEKLKDIHNQTVYVQASEDEKLKRAKEVLAEEVDVTFDVKENISVLAEALVAEDVDIIYMNSAYYEMALEEVENFTEDKTRILATMDVAVEGGFDAKAIDVTKNPFNIYVSGIDATGSISNVARSDVNMILTVNPQTHKILLTSIPRDYYVELASYGAYDKLTHSGIYGIEETVATVENLLDIEINYYVKVNFTTVTKLVDALGGITVDSDYAFTSKDGYYYEEGENHVNGEEALSFARERKAFAAGDNQRVKNQQAVITGIIEKVTGSTAILTSYSNLLEAMSDNVEMNMSSKDITSLVKMQMGDMRGWDIDRCSLKGSGDSATTYSIPNAYAYVMRPDPVSVEAAKQKIDEVMGVASDAEAEAEAEAE